MLTHWRSTPRIWLVLAVLAVLVLGASGYVVYRGVGHGNGAAGPTATTAPDPVLVVAGDISTAGGRDASHAGCKGYYSFDLGSCSTRIIT